MKMGLTVHFNSELHSKRSNVYCATVAIHYNYTYKKHDN